MSRGVGITFKNLMPQAESAWKRKDLPLQGNQMKGLTNEAGPFKYHVCVSKYQDLLKSGGHLCVNSALMYTVSHMENFCLGTCADILSVVLCL